jgi:BSD domain
MEMIGYFPPSYYVRSGMKKHLFQQHCLYQLCWSHFSLKFVQGDKEVPVAPWSGYQNEEDLKEKILALSADSRNFLRAPPGGVNFDLETSGVAAHALVLLKEDPRLERMRYELVPKKVKEDEFWRNYFYRVGLVKQSFELTHGLAAEVAPPAAKTPINSLALEEEQQQPEPSQPEPEEFVSDSHRVSSQDLAEADEAMKKLGLAKVRKKF